MRTEAGLRGRWGGVKPARNPSVVFVVGPCMPRYNDLLHPYSIKSLSSVEEVYNRDLMLC